MKVHLIRDEELVSLVKKGYCELPMQNGWESKDTVIFYQPRQICDGDTVLRRMSWYESIPIIYKVEEESYKTASRSIFINNVSFGAVELFERFFESYRECVSVDEIVCKFDSLTREKLYYDIVNIVKRVHMHKAISDKQAQILTWLFTNEKTKKQLADEGFCTYEEMNTACQRFVNDLEYCYVFKTEWITDAANRFCDGELHFKHSLSKFASVYGGEVSVLQKIADAVVYGCQSISNEEKEFILYVIENDNYETEFNEEKRKEIDKTVKKIVTWFKTCEKKFYTAHAEMLIKIGITNITQIHDYCKRNGLNRLKIHNCMNSLGVDIRSHTGCGSRLISDCWF